MIDRHGPGGATVVCPNPFYQIYEGAALLATPAFVATAIRRATSPPTGTAIDEATWSRTQLLYTCSPGSPRRGDAAGQMGAPVRAERPPRVRHRQRRVLFGDPFRDEPPLAVWRPARWAARTSRRLVVLSSLSKRSNVPGMRSGFVAGDASVIQVVPALPHLPRQRPMMARWCGGRQHRGLERREPMSSPTASSTAEVRPGHADAGRCSTCGCPTPGSTCNRAGVPGGDDRLRPAAARSIQCRGAAGQPWPAMRRGSNPGRGRIRMALVASTDGMPEAARASSNSPRRVLKALTHELTP